MNRILFASVLLMILFSLNSFSSEREVTITGRVFLLHQTAHDGVTVNISYNLLIDELNMTTTTDEKGFYSFTFLVDSLTTIGTVGGYARPYILTYSKNGFQSIEISRTMRFSEKMEPQYMIPEGSNLQRNEICIVTKDSKSRNNLVAWERIDGQDIAGYIVKRYNNKSEVFDSVGYVDFDSVSVFEDVGTDTVKRGLYYSIIPVYNDGTKGIPSRVVKSLHLNLNKIINNDRKVSAINIKIEDFMGVDYNRFAVNKIEVLGGTDTCTLEPIKSYLAIDEFIADGVLNGLKRDIAKSGNYYFRIVMTYLSPCTPTNVKSDSGPFSQSISNLAESGYVEAEEEPVVNSVSATLNNKLNVSPVPANNVVKIDIPYSGSLSVFDTNGSLNKELNVNKGNIELDCSDLSEGLYNVILKSDSGISSGKIFIIR